MHLKNQLSGLRIMDMCNDKHNDKYNKMYNVSLNLNYDVNKCIEKSQNYLLSKQHKEGYWVGLLEADVSVVAGFIPLIRIFGIKNIDREKKAYNYFKNNQNKDGSWSLYYKGEGSLDVTVQTYFCLKIIGLDNNSSVMTKAREFILSKGGIEKTNTYTKIILALFGQYAWSALPIVPPEIIYLPKWFYINIYDFASWTRATILAFSIILTLRPVFNLEEGVNIFELYENKKNIKTGVPFKAKSFFSLENIFLALNSALNFFEKFPSNFKLSRKHALKKVEEWIVSHQENDGSWGGIMLPWLFSLIALKCIGYDNENPIIKKGLKGLEDFIGENENIFILQPATSPVWDTAWTTLALANSGLERDNLNLQMAAKWLLKKQIKTYGDWKVKNPLTMPGCWSFEFENKFYPDVDDTAIVCCALNSVQMNKEEEFEKAEAIYNGLNWILDMQNKDGSWAAFDRDNNKKLLKFIPYADFITPLDFGSPDITAHVLYAIGSIILNPLSLLKANTSKLKDVNKDLFFRLHKLNFNKNILKAFKYLIESQEEDGSWYGRWGIAYIYGTSKVLQSYEYYKHIIRDYNLRDYNFQILEQYINKYFETAILKAKKWLEQNNNTDGGWGESCDSFEFKKFVSLKSSTASQTAWAVLGLLAVEPQSEYAKNGIKFLINSQNTDGSWSEDFYTGGGFPGTFYLKYEMYKDYFPLLALSKFKKINF